MRTPIYMDYHATTPFDPRVLDAMLPFFKENFGNAASRNHPFGWQAEAAVEASREQVAMLFGARAKEIVFTAGATESNNLALKGVLEYHREKGNHIVTCATEHRSVIDTSRSLERKGSARVTVLPVDRYGQVDPDAVDRAITAETVLVSIMIANNEVGTIHPVSEIGKVTKRRGVLFHTDATQAVGKIPVDVERMGIDLLSLSAHKICGPKGVGALYVRSKDPRVRLAPLIEGGGQERGLRSGTLNVPGIVGFGRACEIAGQVMAEEARRVSALRDQLEQTLASELDRVTRNGHPRERLPGNLNLSFAFVEAESLLMALNREVALSTGSACSSATLEPSYVLKALGQGEEIAHSSIRFGLGRFTTESEVETVARRVIAEVRRLRAMSTQYAMASVG
ncbi:MAG TPA: IscS subfamily cysteine desulfurase [Candidatus Binatia bacterium]|nr:IscS subfamily cysteine desulfurase [Candidatus Binatia bacterium]